MRTSDEDLFHGQVVEKYTVLGVLGQGGMATVYKVRHNLLGTVHALKVLHQSRPSIRRRLMLEGQVQARLRHNHIVSVTDVLELEAGIGLVLEFVEGTDLETLIRRKRLSLAQIDALAEGIFRGVEAAHQAGLVHRDLKPANVLLKVEGRQLVPKVADFGLVKDESELSSTRSGVAMGTPRYMAPEQIRDAKTADQRSDVFSLGALLYAMVTGEEAFCPGEGDIVQVFMAVYGGTYVPVRELRPDVPERIEQAIDQALRVEADERHPSVEAFRACWYDQSEDGALWDLSSVTGEAATELTESLPELMAGPSAPSEQTFALTPAPAERQPAQDTSAVDGIATLAPPDDPPATTQEALALARGPRRRGPLLALAAVAGGALALLVMALVITIILRRRQKREPVDLGERLDLLPAIPAVTAMDPAPATSAIPITALPLQPLPAPPLEVLEAERRMQEIDNMVAANPEKAADYLRSLMDDRQPA